MAAAGATTAIICELLTPAEGISDRKKNMPAAIQRLRSAADQSPSGGKVLLQPRLCNLRSYGSGAIRSPARDSGSDASSFFASLANYVESARHSHEFEIVSGRLAMIAFAAAVGVELVTGNSIFKKLNFEQIAGAAGICLAVVASAAAFAWFSSARARIGQMLTLSCNSFVDSLVDNIIDGLFFERDLSDWSDDM
ncbi:Stress enhanced protein 2, chloroplastic [Apostasia shenzhenica]|uniref:Stress enhanced protein 2, chloroplastic n=1 Tax=Apostasia shenzhenica TaxID=1088818 RepID=A0A2I0BFM4_9ASPA|nr:Stress enhanced protein 2, chloroplastic [Apostasia shenzhenica]